MALSFLLRRKRSALIDHFTLCRNSFREIFYLFEEKNQIYQNITIISSTKCIFWIGIVWLKRFQDVQSGRLENLFTFMQMNAKRIHMRQFRGNECNQRAAINLGIGNLKGSKSIKAIANAWNMKETKCIGCRTSKLIFSNVCIEEISVYNWFILST